MDTHTRTASDPARILVVDDEFGIREGCRRILSAEGFDVEVAEDGQAGLEKFQAGGRFGVVLADLKMPRMGGIDLIERITPIDPDAVVLIITAYATIETAVEATKRGAYGYIPKPFTPDELLVPVRQGLERRALALEARRLRAEREERLLEVAFERSKSNTIINCMTDAVIVVNREGQVVLRNAAAARVLPECAGVRLPAALDGALASRELRDLLNNVLAEKEGPVLASKEVSIGRCTFLVNASPVFDHPGSDGGPQYLGAVAVLRDITPLKKLEEAKSMFVRMVAHEIKNPLAAIEGYLDVILSGAAGTDPDRDRAMMTRAMGRAKALRVMVSDLLNLTAIDAGRLSLRRVPTDLRTVVAQVIEGLGPKAAQKKIELTRVSGTTDEVSEKAEGCSVLADADAMWCIVSNLVDNAIKYTPDGGRVSVSVAGEGGYVQVSVQDTGIGMTPEEKEHAFDEFYRAKNEYTAKVPGTGLGLTLVRRMVELHQGRICVDTAPGQGSRFTVSLPAAS